MYIILVLTFFLFGIFILLPTVEPMMDTSTLKTGDLVLFSSSRSWTRMFLRFTHVGMIIVQNNRVFVLEIHQRGDVSLLHDTGKVVMYPFWERVRQYPGRVYVATLHNPEVLKPFDDLRQFEYYDHYASHYVKKCILGMPCKKPPHLVYCSELVGNMLKIPEDQDPECLTPAGLLDLGFHSRPRLVTKPLKMESNC